VSHDVVRVHVADLVPEHGGQLVVVVQRGEQAGVHVHVTAGHGEGIDARVADDRELVVEVRVVQGRRDALADAVDVRDDVGIVDHRRALADGEVELLPELALALVRDRAGTRRYRRQRDEPGDDAVQMHRVTYSSSSASWRNCRARIGFSSIGAVAKTCSANWMFASRMGTHASAAACSRARRRALARGPKEMISAMVRTMAGDR
jgi:hypothetical protein